MSKAESRARDKGKSQIQKFRETARTLGADQTEAEFDAALGKVAQYKPATISEDGAPSGKAKRTEVKIKEGSLILAGGPTI